MKTRREIEQFVSGLGGDDAIATFLAGLDAGYRHQARVASTRKAADAAARQLIEAGAATRPDGSTPSVEAVAEAVLAFDSIGVGGTGDAEGIGTSRLPCFAALGKGRKQATDGAAWMAALEATLPVTSPSWGMFTVVPEGPTGPRLAWKNTEEVMVFNPKQLPDFAVPVRWLIAVVRRAAWAAAREKGLVEAPLDVDLRFIDVTVSLQTWVQTHALLMEALTGPK